ncbi:hypothetical protein [Limnohabitans sp. Jir72]|uniref:hypothetical protein n=1 Tax=Limnohabitans sp. Jir72 TaxID=1977909 RepID=UPI000D3584BC|nr:hypothetical protein [Limnohabitans sp. Jir72]PUE34403.1 hypothetical protein B9Z52_05720 [Limnohabitans sp. Jir72]
MNERFYAWWVLGLALTGLCLWGAFYTASQPDESVTAPLALSMAVPSAADQALLANGGQGEKGLAVLAAQPLRSGRWGQFERGQLRPDSDLRRRFDQLLAQRTTQAWSDMRNTVQALAMHDLSPEGVQAVVQIWDNYLNLLIWDETMQNQLDLKALTADQWIVSRLDFFRQARSLLGPEWAQAFFAEDQAQLEQLARGLQDQRGSSGLRDQSSSTPSP